MALETKKSIYITDRDATPTLPVDAYIAGGEVRSGQGYVTTSVSASTGSTYILCSVPANSRVKSLDFEAAAQGATCQVNIGVYWPTNLPPVAIPSMSAVANAPISAAFFASGLSVSAADARQSVLNQSGNNPVNLQGKQLWDALGLVQDPNCYLDITVEIVTNPAVSGGLMGLAVDYVF